MARNSEEVSVNLDVIGLFPAHWEQKRLDEVCKLVTDGTHDSPKETESGFPLVTGKSIKGRNIDFSSTYNISKEDHLKVISRSKAERHDLLFANIGNSIGDLVRVDTDRDFSIKNLALFKPNLELIHPRYLEYYFFSTRVQNFIKNSTRGSAQPFIGLASLRAFPIALPPMKEQQYIAKLLGDIDDKISINTQTNQTLEEMAQAIFKSWFVDFDPVKAKMNGEQPEGMDEATAALFPDQLVESELGLIPEGWETVKLGDIVERLKPKKRYTKNQVESYGKTPVYEQGASILLGFHNDDAEFNASPEEPIFIFGDHTCITYLSCSQFDISSNVIPLKGSIRPTIWTYYAIQGKQEFQEYRRHWSEFIVKNAVLPPLDLTQKFAEVVTANYLMMESLKGQSKRLEQVRDTLLPKLLSGEINLD